MCKRHHAAYVNYETYEKSSRNCHPINVRISISPKKNTDPLKLPQPRPQSFFPHSSTAPRTNTNFTSSIPPAPKRVQRGNSDDACRPLLPRFHYTYTYMYTPVHATFTGSSSGASPDHVNAATLISRVAQPSAKSDTGNGFLTFPRATDAAERQREKRRIRVVCCI